jgi:dipeptidyl aminopeptidase/acylaminoacyl peptidase
LEKIKSRGGKVKYIEFEGEGHGWRKSENIKRATEEELAWYEEVFGLGCS